MRYETKEKWFDYFFLFVIFMAVILFSCATVVVFITTIRFIFN